MVIKFHVEGRAGLGLSDVTQHRVENRTVRFVSRAPSPSRNHLLRHFTMDKEGHSLVTQSYTTLMDEKRITIAPEVPPIPSRNHKRVAPDRNSLARILAAIIVLLYITYGLYQAALKNVEVKHEPLRAPSDVVQLYDTLFQDDWTHHENFTCEDAKFERDFLESNHTLSFNLTTGAENIKVFTRGPIIGNITIVSGGTAGDDIEIDITVHNHTGDHHPPHGYPNHDMLDEPGKHPHGPHKPHLPWVPPAKVKVCPFKDKDGKIESLGIFAYRELPHHGPHNPKPHPPRDAHYSSHCNHPSDFGSHNLHPKPPKPPKPPRGPTPPPKDGPSPPPRPARASIDIRFPDTSNLKEPLVLKSFSSDNVGFKHKIGDLDVQFDKFNVVGSVEAEGVSAQDIAIVTVFGGIYGSFSVSENLALVSTAGHIDVDVEIWAYWTENDVPATQLGVVNTGGYIWANVSLLTDNRTPFGAPPYYSIETSSWGYPTWVFTPQQPPVSLLRLKTFSKWARSTLSLHPVFQGPFILKSVFNRPTWWVNPSTKDPFGHGRPRTVKIIKDRISYVEGRIDWGPTPPPWDKLNLTTSRGSTMQPVSYSLVEATTIGAPVHLLFP
ncbi:hypothetical protein FRB99_000491 [Tulasnella sp. 403]|nr:hypothetical protein FRB99_000491 [Tulasnella sp. 403]